MQLPKEKTMPKTALSDYTTLIYGMSKAGKTSLCAEIPDALFLSCEPGTNALFQARKTARRQSSKIVAEFFELCRSLKETEVPSSPVAEAISYALNIEKELKEFLDNPKLNIDNNPAERMMKSIAISRKNWLFTASEAGGKNLAILFSFAETCKANNVNFRLWLEDVLPRLNTTPAKQIDTLLPHLWQPSEKN
ncbi:MAG: hypothetical protein A2017_02880 [Lentisphaerae bacterium GWF2_44_16]|nr:MAG: hypothetical protein A2017_02880 [Lentisphaerae bacterium GWF2_44_16]